MKKWLCIVTILFLFCNPALAEKMIVTDFDGTDWQTWEEARKYNFLTGFLLASTYIIKRNTPFMPTDYRETQIDDIRKRLSLKYDKKIKTSHAFSKDEVILWGHYRASMVQSALADYAVYDTKVSQLAKGMDELYKNPKNLKITIADAIYVVKKQLKGTKPGEIENTLHFLRED